MKGIYTIENPTKEALKPAGGPPPGGSAGSPPALPWVALPVVLLLAALLPWVALPVVLLLAALLPWAGRWRQPSH